MSVLDAADVQRWLDLPAETMSWLQGIERPSGSCGPVLPDDADAEQLLERLGVDPTDRAETLAARPDPDAHPDLWWVLDRAYHEILATMGAPVGAGLAALPATTGPVGRHLYVWLFLAVLPDVRRYHTEVGVPDDVSWDSLAALGDEMTSSRLLSGISGLDSTWGLPLVFRGASYRLGRLAFDRQRPQPDPSDHPLLHPGQSGLNTHVPAGRRRLDPAACDDSFARAREFFPNRFPEQVVAFGCHSWLMDDQLARYLPETSNIIRFQRRFEVFTDREPADWAPLGHLFHRRYEGSRVPDALLDELPQETTLQRAIVTHLRAGGHWYNRTGWFPF
jgi:hypothetical protein